MKIQIRTHIYNKLNSLAKANEIGIQALANELLARMLNDHHAEIKGIIETLKKR